MNKYVLDASALLVLINSEPGHEKVKNYLPDACMSTVNLSETAATLQNLSIPEKEIISILKSLINHVIPFDEEQAYASAQLKSITKSKGLSLEDRACLSLGKIKKLPVITADKVWKELSIDIEIILIR